MMINKVPSMDAELKFRLPEEDRQDLEKIVGEKCKASPGTKRSDVGREAIQAYILRHRQEALKR